MRCLTFADHAGDRGAQFSDCGAYRYRLWREWDRALPRLAFVMLNPSTADHRVDDPTIRRCVAQAVARRFGRLEVVNLFPLRATHPEALLAHPDPLGPRGMADDAIADAVAGADAVICGWGAHAAARARAHEVERMLRLNDSLAKLFSLGLNKDGSPKHPLYVAAGARMVPFVLAR
jgi:hypothetical protein